MASRTKFFSWSKGRQSSDDYHRTGGLLAIESIGYMGNEPILVGTPKSTTKTGRQRPPNLNLTIPLDKNLRSSLTPASARNYSALSSSASNLLAVMNDMMRSPASMCPKSAPEIHKPLPRRPRSVSLPSSPTLPVELPGSILLENQGFPSTPDAGSATRSTMRPTRSVNSLSANVAAKPSPSKVPLRHRRSSSEANVNLQRRSKSRPSLMSPSSTDGKIATCSVSTNRARASSSESIRARIGAEKPLQPSLLAVEGKPWDNTGGERPTISRQDELGTASTPPPTSTNRTQTEELKATIVAQDQTISTLQAQFGRVRASHEAEIAALKDAHEAQVEALKDYSQVLEQQSQRTLHHASSNHLLFLVDTTEPQSPGRESSQNTAGSASATSIRSFKSAFEQQTRSPHPTKDSPEMESLKRKLSAARRPEVGNRDMILQLNQYKQNNTALQKQIESLMAKLNQSKKNERQLTHTLEDIEKNCTEWQAKASKVEEMEKAALALQNTIDHLEYRLEMANTEKLDAEEHLFNLQSGRSAFDPPAPPKSQVPLPLQHGRTSTHTSMSTVFSNSSPIGHPNESENPTTLSAFIAHIERLQEQLKQKESRTAELKQENKRLRHEYELLEREHQAMSLQVDIQGQLLKKTKDADAHIEELRTAIIDRESIIGEKSKSLRMAERQLEHHKLLLHAEIRRHAALSTSADVPTDPLPDLSTLASKEEVDRWIGRLQSRLKKEDDQHPSMDQSGSTAADNLKREVDFYVREIIYYKLDIKGYKSDIKKLKNMATKMGTYGSRASDLESPTPSLSRFLSEANQQRGFSNTSSPTFNGPVSASFGRSVTPPPATPITPDPSPTIVKPVTEKKKHRPHALMSPTLPYTPRTPTRVSGFNTTNEVDNVQPGISPQSVARLSPERRKPTPTSPDQEMFGELATNFPLSTPASPRRQKTQRSMSESIIKMYATPRIPDSSQTHRQGISCKDGEKPLGTRGRSSSLPDAPQWKHTPERPPRPQYGLYDGPADPTARPSTPPCMDVLAEAMRNSPIRAHLRNTSDSPAPYRQRPLGSNAGIPAPSPLLPRAWSANPSSANLPSSLPQRKMSTGSAVSNTPFVIGMPSPHNLTLVTPASIIPTPGSITEKGAHPLKIASSTLRTGVGGTMASYTPVTSPVSPTDTKKFSSFSSTLPIGRTQPLPIATKANTSNHSRNTSLSLDMSLGPLPMQRSDVYQPPADFAASMSMSGGTSGQARSGSASKNTSGLNTGHSRSGSASSFGKMMMGKGKERMRKESISSPTPLTSSFPMNAENEDRSGSGSGNRSGNDSGVRYGGGVGTGQAI